MVQLVFIAQQYARGLMVQFVFIAQQYARALGRVEQRVHTKMVFVTKNPTRRASSQALRLSDVSQPQR